MCIQNKKAITFFPVTASFSGDPGGTQTHNLLIRSQMLYSIKLRGRIMCKVYWNGKQI